jgi:AAA+ ATPase superfamily predicted ATPase
MAGLYQTPENEYEYALCYIKDGYIPKYLYTTIEQAEKSRNKFVKPDEWKIVKRKLSMWEDLD